MSVISQLWTAGGGRTEGVMVMLMYYIILLIEHAWKPIISNGPLYIKLTTDIGITLLAQVGSLEGTLK